MIIYDKKGTMVAEVVEFTILDDEDQEYGWFVDIDVKGE